MPYDPDRHHRRTTRLPRRRYDQPGIYYVTLTTHERACLFGDVVEGVVALSTLGAIVEEEWLKTPQIRPQVALDAYVIMPNHLHALVRLTARAAVEGAVAVGHGDRPLARPPRSLGSLIAGYKAACTVRINAERDTAGARVWQRNYYERIVRNDGELNALRRYIRDNPANWLLDSDNAPGRP